VAATLLALFMVRRRLGYADAPVGSLAAMIRKPLAVSRRPLKLVSITGIVATIAW
jgi:hypothetical protein